MDLNIPRVSKIEQCAYVAVGTSNSWVCNAPYLFSYTLPTNSLFSPLWRSYSTTFSQKLSSNVDMESLTISRTKIMDFNNDGIADRLYIEGDVGGPPVPSSLSLGYLNQNTGSVSYLTAIDGPVFSLRSPLSLAQVDLARIQLVDWNNDGKRTFTSSN